MKQFLYFIFSIGLLSPALAQTGNVWSQTDDFGGGQRARGVGFSLRGMGYFACGIDTANIVRNDLWQYDPASASWSQKANLPAPGRRNAVSFTIGDYAYVGTGVDSSDAPGAVILSDFWKYNPYTNSWSAIADYPGNNGNGVYFATSFANDGKGYVCGGKVGPDSYSRDLYEYKPTLNQWGKRADFPDGSRYQMVSVIGGNKVYMGLGTDEDTHRKDWWEYNPGTNLWTQKNDFPSSERGNCVAFTIDGRPYVGLGGDGGYRKELWEYVPSTDSWISRSEFPAAGRRFSSCFVINNRAYVGLGESATGKKRSVYIYLPYTN